MIAQAIGGFTRFGHGDQLVKSFSLADPEHGVHVRRMLIDAVVSLPRTKSTRNLHFLAALLPPRSSISTTVEPAPTSLIMLFFQQAVRFFFRPALHQQPARAVVHRSWDQSLPACTHQPGSCTEAVRTQSTGHFRCDPESPPFNEFS